MSQLRRSPALLCLALLPLFAAPIAHAKDDHWTFELAAGGGVAPRYSGSEEYRATPSLSFDVTSPGGWFLGTSGIGWGTSSASTPACAPMSAPAASAGQGLAARRFRLPARHG
jgi:outer membrane scaffolding protein for murein synthesis (MipA/OmpV family)